jgi:hypothetical protein
MGSDDSPEKKKGRLATLIGAIVGAIAIIAALLTNIKTIIEFFEPIFEGHAKEPTQTTTQPSPSPSPPPHKVVRVCMGNGGGDNCLSGASAHYDCDAYKAMGGGGQRTTDTLADRFCGYTENGVHKVYPNNIIVYQNNGGGQCGWTGFEVTCN